MPYAEMKTALREPSQAFYPYASPDALPNDVGGKMADLSECIRVNESELWRLLPSQISSHPS